MQNITRYMLHIFHNMLFSKIITNNIYVHTQRSPYQVKVNLNQPRNRPTIITGAVAISNQGSPRGNLSVLLQAGWSNPWTTLGRWMPDRQWSRSPPSSWSRAPPSNCLRTVWWWRLIDRRERSSRPRPSDSPRSWWPWWSPSTWGGTQVIVCALNRNLLGTPAVHSVDWSSRRSRAWSSPLCCRCDQRGPCDRLTISRRSSRRPWFASPPCIGLRRTQLIPPVGPIPVLRMNIMKKYGWNIHEFWFTYYELLFLFYFFIIRNKYSYFI